MFASAGDFGASNQYSFANALYPASDPLVIFVGGTNLFIDDSGNYQSEDVWNDSDKALCPFGCTDGIFGATGGSPSLIFSAPPFQQSVSGNAMRSTSDVIYNASVYTAVLVYLGFGPPAQQGFYFFGGTSEGDPQWAAITALADPAAGHALGYLSPALYAAPSTDFHGHYRRGEWLFRARFSGGSWIRLSHRSRRLERSQSDHDLDGQIGRVDPVFPNGPGRSPRVSAPATGTNSAMQGVHRYLVGRPLFSDLGP